MDALRRWFRFGIGKGALLIACVILACLWRNSSLGNTYEAVWNWQLPQFLLGPFGLESGGHVDATHFLAASTLNLRHFINDGLMALFFLAVTLEIRKEFLFGEFKDARKATLPAFVGVFGMAGPALVCAAFTWGTPYLRAWPIPVSTDIALSLAVLALSARHLPRPMRPFMAAMALVDDIGGILLVAFLFTSHFAFVWAVAAIIITLAAWIAFRKVKPHLGWVAILFILLWVCFSNSGVNASLSGVVVALLIPARQHSNGHNFVSLYENLVSPPVDFLILPLFLLANAGAELSFGGREAFIPRLFWGVALGLFLGKSISMYFTAKGVVKSGLGALPAGITNPMLLGFSFVGGVGLKMCIFLVPLALSDENARSVAILGLYTGLTASAIAGTAILRLAPRPQAPALPQSGAE